MAAKSVGHRMRPLVIGFGFLLFPLNIAAQNLGDPSKDKFDELKVDEEFYHDFRNKNSSNPNLTLIGSDLAEHVKSEAEGLRITLPAEGLRDGRIVVAAQFTIKGDFEVTARYQILHMDRPKGRSRVGFLFYLGTSTTGEPNITFYRMFLADGRDVYRSRHINNQGRQKYGDYIAAAGGQTGQMRIARNGSSAVLSAAEEPDNEFRELYRWDLGTGDIQMLGIGPQQLDGRTAVDLRLIDLRIRGAALPASNTSLETGPRALWLVGILTASGLLAGSLWLWRRRSRNERGEGTPQVPDGEEVREIHLGSVHFQCVRCAKILSVEAKQASWKMQCPQCSADLHVPWIEVNGG